MSILSNALSLYTSLTSNTNIYNISLQHQVEETSVGRSPFGAEYATPPLGGMA